MSVASPSLKRVSLTDLDTGSELLQSGFWGYYKQQAGQIAHPFFIETIQSGKPIPLLVLERRLPGGFSLGYIPHGPLLPEEPIENPALFLSRLGEELRRQLPRRCVFLRFDLPWHGKELDGLKGLTKERLKKAPVEIQPPSTVLLDLTRGEDELLGGMKSKTRYNIRLAEKKGVEVHVGTPEDLRLWYELYKETAERDRIAIHTYEYYHMLFTCRKEYTGKTPEVFLLLAVIEGETVAGNIIALFGNQAVYLYGASSSRKRNYMPTYALQWRGIQIARDKGCTVYDLFGIPPADNPEHPMYGLFRFKTGFGGEIVHRAGCWDYLFKPGAYRLLHVGEQTRNYYFKKIRKR